MKQAEKPKNPRDVQQATNPNIPAKQNNPKEPADSKYHNGNGDPDPSKT